MTIPLVYLVRTHLCLGLEENLPSCPTGHRRYTFHLTAIPVSGSKLREETIRGPVY